MHPRKTMFVSLVALAWSAAATVASLNDTAPMQVRLAYAGPTGMTVSWNTYCKIQQPTVHYGQ